MELRNGKILSQPRYTTQRIAWEDKKQQIIAAEDMVELFNGICLKKFFKKFKKLTIQSKQVSMYDRWKMDAEISGRL